MKNENDLGYLKSKKYLTMQDVLESSASDAATHLINSMGLTNPRQVLYHLETAIESIPKCPCGNPVSWHTDSRCYRKYCSRACTAKFSVSEKKERYLDSLGVEWHSKTSEWRSKLVETSQERFGETHYSKTEEFKKRVKQTVFDSYGVEHIMLLDSIKESIKQTNLERYGVENAAQCAEVRARISQTNLERYGSEIPARANMSHEAIEFLDNAQLFESEVTNCPVSALSKKYGISKHPIYQRIKERGIVIPKFQLSSFEYDVLTFIKQSYSGELRQGTRDIIPPYEIDIFLPDIKIAIECNGSYWHSELNGRGQHYHLDKTKGCESKGIRLIHIWEHDWADKNDIIKNHLLAALKQEVETVGARSCHIKPIDQATSNQFFDLYHLQGYTQHKVCYGLFHRDALLSAMSFTTPRFTKSADWEILRYASAFGYRIHGGANKLFSHFLKNQNPKNVISYCDRSRMTGNIYLQLGFKHVRDSKPGYFYTQDYQKFLPRYTFQKHRLKEKLNTYDQNITEWENMKANGYDRIWDCGQKIFEYRNYD